MGPLEDVEDIVNPIPRQGLSKHNKLGVGKKSWRVTCFDARRNAPNIVLSVADTTTTAGLPLPGELLVDVEDGLTN